MSEPLTFGARLFLLVLPALLLCFFAACTRTVKRLPNQVPDTLDLSVNAEHALNALGGTLDAENHYEILFGGQRVPPRVRHDAISFAACGPKYTESFVMTRWMTGSKTSLEGEKGMNAYLDSCLGDDGLFYSKIGPDRPWDKTSPEDYANIYGQARTLRAMLTMSQVDNDPIWDKRMKKLFTTLKKIAIRKDNYVYYPTTPGYGDIFSYPRSGWKKTSLLTGAQRHMADLPDHSFGIPLYLGGLLPPLVQYAERTGDKSTLAFAGKLVTFLLLPESGWMPDFVPNGIVAEEHGWFYGHFHAHTMCLRGLLDYAIATNDTKLKNLVRDGYEYARTFGIARLGWFQEYTGKASHETCGLANMVALAIKMSRAGIGDYWDDVDGYLPYEGKVVVRNKTASSISLRIPSWVDRSAVKAMIGRRKAPLHWAGSYLLFGSVATGETLTITFPVTTRTESYKVRDYGHRGTKLLKATTYRITFRGNTAVDIAPRDPKAIFPIYQRKHLKANKAPMKARPTYVASKELDW